MLILIMGKSGAGKNYIYRSIMSSNLKTLLSPWLMYTTRPIRRGEIDGIDMHFCKESFLDYLEKDYQLIEKRKIAKVDGTYYYATRKIDPILAQNNDYLLPEITPECYFPIVNYYKLYNVKTLAIVLETSETINEKRMMERDDGNSIEEINRRIAYDKKIYNEFDEAIKCRTEEEKRNHPIIYCLNTRKEDPNYIEKIIEDALSNRQIILPDYYYRK